MKPVRLTERCASELLSMFGSERDRMTALYWGMSIVWRCIPVGGEIAVTVDTVAACITVPRGRG